MKKYILSVALLSAAYANAQTIDSIDASKELKIEEVIITKKLFKKESDRFVFDVSNAPLAKGSTTFQVLKQTPMVSTFDDNTLKISGKNNAIIFINGRKSNMNAAAVIELLKNTPAENIQKIEVITTPGSEFQVEASDGIINIVLKRKSTDGFNGNISMRSTVNKYNANASSFSGNYRKDKLGINGLFSLSNRLKPQFYSLQNSSINASNTSEGEIQNPSFDYGGYLNVDYQLNDNSNIALNWNSWNSISDDINGELFNTIISNQTEFYTKTRSVKSSRNWNNSLNLNYEWLMDDLESKINANVAYLKYTKHEDDSNKTINSNFLKQDLNINRKLVQSTPQLIDNLSATLDYVKKVSDDFKISLGGSYNKTLTENDTKSTTYAYQYDNWGNLSNTLVIENPNAFKYDENIYGMYLTVDKSFGEKLQAKIGTRYEITNSIGKFNNASNPLLENIKRSYNNILPFVSLNYSLNDKNAISYSFSSRMRRPSFWELNPVKSILTENNYIQNNPFVKASSTYNQSLNYMLNNSYYLTLTHSYIKDVITQVPLQRTVSQGGIDYQQLRYIRTNFGDKQEISATLGMNKSFFKQYLTTNFNVGIQHNINNGSLSVDPTTGDLFPEYVNKKSSTSIFVQTNNTIRLDKEKTWFLGVNYFFVDQQQIELGLLKPLMSLDLTLKKVWNNWTFSAHFNDVFKTNIIEIIDKQNNGNLNYIWQNHYNRGGGIGIIYNFGNQKVKKVRSIDSAVESIKNRT